MGAKSEVRVFFTDLHEGEKKFDNFLSIYPRLSDYCEKSDKTNGLPTWFAGIFGIIGDFQKVRQNCIILLLRENFFNGIITLSGATENTYCTLTREYHNR